MLIKLLSLYLFIAVLLLSFLFVYSFVRGRTTHAKVMGILSLSLQIYLLGYLLEINVVSLSEMYFWNQIQYFGIPFFPSLWLLISLLYTGRLNTIKSSSLFIIFIIPVITFFIRLTNDYHFLYYKSVELLTLGDFSTMLLTKGPWYLVQMIYVFVALVLCTWFYYQRYRRSSGNEKMQFSLLLFASSLPYLALILVFVNWGGIGIDYTAIILPPCIFLINIALTKYNFLDIKNLARERVFEDSSIGFILLNRLNRVVDYNDISRVLFSVFDISLKEGKIDKLLENELSILECIKNSCQKTFYRNIDNKDYFISISVKEIKNKEEIIGQLITVEDVTERERLKNSLLEMANTDVLSGLNNRRRFRECAEDAFNRSLRYKENLSVLMMDIDLFKRINDAYGHSTGDLVIQAFSKVLKESFRSTDIVSRMGGEEFSVVLINCDIEMAYLKAEQFRKQIEAFPIVIENKTIIVNVSIGVSTFSDEINNLDTLINRADHALYSAKEQGRNRTVLWS